MTSLPRHSRPSAVRLAAARRFDDVSIIHVSAVLLDLDIARKADLSHVFD